MERILLATYSFKIKDSGNDQILSRFNGNDDFFTVIDRFCSEIFQNVTRASSLTGENTIHITLESQHSCDIEFRCIYGKFSSGVSGDRFTIRNMTTNTPELEVEPHHAAFRNVFFYFYIPTGRTIGYLILQRKAKFGIKTILTRAIINYLNELGYQRYRFEIFNILHNNVYRRMMELGSLKSVDLIKRTIPNSLERFMQDQNVSEIPGTFVRSFKSSTSLPLEWKPLLDRLFRQHDGYNDRILIDNVDEQFDEIEFELELNGKKKSFYIRNKSRIQPDVDVTSNVDIVENEPTIESLVLESKEIINEILEIRPQ